MHSLLKNYLSTVEQKLGTLPPHRRADEIREIRQHLMASIEDSRENGQSEDDAVKSALEKFGPASEAANGILQAWKRAQWMNARSVAGPVACALLFTVIVPAVILILLGRQMILAAHAHTYSSWYTVSIVFGSLLFCAIAGVVNGFVFPEKAVTITAVTVIACRIFSLVNSIEGELTLPRQYVHNDQLLSMCAINVVFAAVSVVITVVAARAASAFRRSRLSGGQKPFMRAF